ncbi:MAG: tRNA(Ile)-lysidine synthase [Limisphaerales bacterium]|jgi:tRNA(Ile)-lysidine synthase
MKKSADEFVVSLLDKIRSQEAVLVCCSAGLDSTVLAHLCHIVGIRFGIAHVQYGLRGEDSVADETFVKALAAKYKVPFYLTDKTEAIKTREKKSVQMAARTLRYAWFEEVRKKHNYHCIATAHHKNDQAETVLIRLLRGDGIASFAGISTHSKIIRPLLEFDRITIKNWAEENNLLWREDKSNSDVKYLRNKVRHEILPLLKTVNPAIEEKLIEISRQQKNNNVLAKEGLRQFKKRVLTKSTNKNIPIRISILKLKQTGIASTLLHHLLSPSFTAAQISDIALQFDNAEPGAVWLSAQNNIAVRRERKVLSLLSTNKLNEEDEKHQAVLITEAQSKCKVGSSKFKFELTNKKLNISKDADKAFLDSVALQFPLVLRRWQAGDYFYPFGLNKKQKIKNFLTNEKVPVATRANTLVLVSGEKIVWVVGHRIDHRFRVKESTSCLYKISFQQ